MSSASATASQERRPCAQPGRTREQTPTSVSTGPPSKCFDTLILRENGPVHIGTSALGIRGGSACRVVGWVQVLRVVVGSHERWTPWRMCLR
jgi:hypothetical protein